MILVFERAETVHVLDRADYSGEILGLSHRRTLPTTRFRLWFSSALPCEYKDNCCYFSVLQISHDVIIAPLYPWLNNLSCWYNFIKQRRKQRNPGLVITVIRLILLADILVLPKWDSSDPRPTPARSSGPGHWAMSLLAHLSAWLASVRRLTTTPRSE